MALKTKTVDNVESTTTETIKAKRGRRSKKELMAALKIKSLVKENDTKNTIILNVSEVETPVTKDLNTTENTQTNIYEDVLNDDKINSIEKTHEVSNIIITTTSTNEEPKVSKKRGRKPKGGKIIQQVVNTQHQKEEKPNIILHLKCFMKELQTSSQSNNFIEPYNFLVKKGDLNYELLENENENVNTINFYRDNNKNTTSITILDTYYDCDNYYEDSLCKDSTKEIWKKLKQLEHNLHINNVNNKRSACFWDTSEFDNPPIYIPKHFINGTYHVYGCFCSPECGVAYLMNESIDSSTKFERYHLFNHIYSKIYDYKKNIKPAPNPYYMLEKFYGNLSIQEYRSLLKNERLFLIVDKPLTRILPELHEDNDDFILNNKIIPSNNYQIKTRLQRKKQNKSSILNEKFGTSNSDLLE